MREYYTSVTQRFGKILYRGYAVDESGVKRRTSGKIPYKPTMYLEDPSGTEYKSLYGVPLVAKKFDAISEAKEYVKSYKDVMPIYGYEPGRFEYNFIAESFTETMEVSASDITIGVVDIETTVDHGKIDAINAPEEITLISYQNPRTKKLVTFGARPVTGVDNYILCSSEAEVIKQFIQYFVSEDPDIITGWNCKLFDMTYIINRGFKLLDESLVKSLSPFGVLDKKQEEINGKIQECYVIVGRTILDLLDLYKKFTFIKKNSYKLQNIAMDELGVGKMENKYGSFKEWYTKDFSEFTRYNQIDVVRVSELDDKLGLISLAMFIAYKTRVNYGDVYGPVKMWECFIFSTLLRENTFVPIKRKSSGSVESIIGAYVHKPKPGLHGWGFSVDAASLYPSIAIGLNMSPETILGVNPECSEESLLAGFDNSSESYSIAGNGAMFSKDKQGIIPRLMQSLTDDRGIAKKNMLKFEQEYINTGDILFKNRMSFQNTAQAGLKVLNNSGYGGIANTGFILFDNRIAEGITMTGRFVIQFVGNRLNDKMNEFFKTNGVEYLLYSDTDSCVLVLDNVIKKYYTNNTDEEIVDAIDKLVEKHLRKFINEATAEISKRQNYYKETLVFKREKIFSSSLMLAPKKYALKVYDNEGVRYKDPKIAITGIEVVRSSTPEIARVALKTCVTMVLDKDIEKLKILVDKSRDEFLTAPIEDIAFPRGANNLLEYSSDQTIYTKGCPIAVRASLLHNHYVEKLNLGDKYQPIQEGSRIKFVYLKQPNHIKENIIAFEDTLPPEFRLEKYIDRELQFEKVFMAPLNGILDAVGWTLTEKQDLDDFFS